MDWECGICGKEFETREQVRKHKQKAHKTKEGSWKCKFCNNPIGTLNHLRGNLCKDCKKLEDVKKENTKVSEKFRGLVEKGISNIEESRKVSNLNNKTKKDFQNNFEEMVERLKDIIYSLIYRFVVGTLESSLNLTLEMGKITKKRYNELMKNITSPLKEIEDEERDFSKRDYEILKKKIKNQDTIEIINKIEKEFALKELEERIGDYVKKVEDEEISERMLEIKHRRRDLRIREEAEKRAFGKIKIKRQALSKEEKEAIFEKYDNECAICGAKEGLNIHHKDGNPKNNNTKNLIVLCGVCHKKAHMRVR